MQIKQLPLSERPIEKVWMYGIEQLSNSELLALIIHTGTGSKSAIGLAEEVLAAFPNGIGSLGSCCKEDLVDISGIGKTKACAILAAVEIGKRISTAPGKRKVSAVCSEDVASMFMEELRYLKKEHFRCVLVNAKGEVISVDHVSVGELTSTVVHPREVFNSAVRKSAAGVILIHNHPSGDPTPSTEDIETTRRLTDAGRVLGIKVLDHIIIGDGKYTSLNGLGYIT